MNQRCIIVTLYRSPSQSSNEFDYFLLEFETLIDNIYNYDNNASIMILGDFNAKHSSWKPDDSDSDEGIRIDAITSSYGLSQLISDPTHILGNSSSCIDLIFTNNPTMILHSGTHPSLHQNSHHQIIFAKLSFNIFHPPPYERQIWHYSRADVDSIRRSIELFDWCTAFQNVEVDKQVEIFNSTLLNIFSNFIPNEKIIIDEFDPPWITQLIRNKLEQIEYFHNYYLINNRNELDLQNISAKINDLNNLINESKKAYYNRLCNKLSSPITSPKCYWSILKSLFSGKKVPKIPPIFVNNCFVSDFKAKANIFNEYFSNQCNVLENDSTLPENVIHSDANLFSIDLKEDALLKLIRSLDISKSHGHDNLSNRMLKICDSSIVKPLIKIFRNCVEDGKFPSQWKKANVTPIHKKGDKSLISNYRPISVLPICSKLFEKMIYTVLYKYLCSNNILDINQSGFRSGDSCTNQLTAIIHDILKSFDSNPTLEVRGVFLDISKAFDRVWHEGLIYKLECQGVQGNFLKLIKDFLNERFQRVVLNGQSSSWSKVNAGVPQGSILGPLLFLVYINDISEGLRSNIKLFADDTCLFSTVHDPILSASDINHDLEKISHWAFQWKMLFNPDPSKQAKEVVFSRKRNDVQHPDLIFNQSTVQRTTVQKHLGLLLDEKLSFNYHVKDITDKANKTIGVLRKLRYYIPRRSLLTLYKTFIRSSLDYADVIYDLPYNSSFVDKIESIQYNASLAITGAIRGTSKEKLYLELGLESLQSRRWFRRLCSFYKILKNKAPIYLYNIIPDLNNFLNTRNRNLIPHIFCRTNAFSNSFFPFCVSEWRKLDPKISQLESFSQFRKSLLSFIRPLSNSIFDICDEHGLKLLTRLRLGLSHLRKHKFDHGFLDSLNPICSCDLEVEDLSHFLLRCPNYNQQRLVLMNEVDIIYPNISYFNDIEILKSLMYGIKTLSIQTNSKLISATIKYIKQTKRFEGPLFQ